MSEIVCFLDAHNGALSAVASIVIAIFTIALAISTIALACSTKRLWSEAKIASRIAYKSAVAAKKSANISERALLQAQRAFISAENVMIVPVIQNGGIIKFAARVGWTNTGGTNAIHAKAGVTHTITDSIVIETVHFVNEAIKQNDNMTIGSRSSSITSQDEISVANMTNVWNGKGRLFILARVEYDDVFGIPHHTQACAEMQPFLNPFNLPPVANTFQSIVWKEHNSSD